MRSVWQVAMRPAPHATPNLDSRAPMACAHAWPRPHPPDCITIYCATDVSCVVLPVASLSAPTDPLFLFLALHLNIAHHSRDFFCSFRFLPLNPLPHCHWPASPAGPPPTYRPHTHRLRVMLEAACPEHSPPLGCLAAVNATSPLLHHHSADWGPVLQRGGQPPGQGRTLAAAAGQGVAQSTVIDLHRLAAIPSWQHRKGLWLIPRRA